MKPPLGGGRLWMITLVVLAGTIAGCGAGGANECTPGQSIACVCTNGQSGAQTCGADGTFGACSCDGTIDAGTIDTGATDNGEIFVVNRGDSSIRVFDRAASGDVEPLRMIRGGNSQLAAPVSIAVDAMNGEIFVANAADDSINVYPIDANGNVAPTRRIVGASTGLSIIDAQEGSGCGDGIGGLHVDPVNDEIVIACTEAFEPGCLLTFSRTANGDVAPLRNISGATTMMVTGPLAIVVDVTNDEIFAVWANRYSVFERAANGDIAPMRSVQPVPAVSCQNDVGLDLANGELWTLGANKFHVFARTANGSAPPLRTIDLQSAGDAMFLDPDRGEAIMVSNQASNQRIGTFSLAGGAAIRAINGSSTGLDLPSDITVVP